jgi:hypothetical protein
MHYSNQVVGCLDDMGRRVLVRPASEEACLSTTYGERTLKLSRDAILFSIDVAGLPKHIFSASLTD